MIQELKHWLKRSEDQRVQRVKENLLRWRTGNLRFFRFFGSFFWHEAAIRVSVWRWIKRACYYNPMLYHRCAKVGKNPYLESRMPFIMGHGRIEIGDDFVASGVTSLIVGYDAYAKPVLRIGNNVTLSHFSMISVAQEVKIGNHVTVGSGVQIYDNTSHPLDVDPLLRMRMRLRPEDCAPVNLEEGCWIAANSIVLKGVTVGKGSVVAANSVVTHDIPPMVLAGGVPARILRPLRIG